MLRIYAILRTWCVLLSVMIALSAGAAHANPKYGSIVIDASTGKTLLSENSTKLLHPASLTKMMTLYMVFDAIERGELSLDQNIRISQRATQMPPSRLGLKAGTRIRLRTLIRAAAVKSANDSAVVLAEAVAGSESNFAKRMTKKARQLGMKRTTFKNASGLTSKGHMSTPKDMAILARALWRDFPQHYALFKRAKVTYRGRTYRNTNKLLSSYDGADGIKTGYTNAAGYNLAASADKNGRRVIAVVFGGKSSKSRNAHVKDLLDRGFAALPKRKGILMAAPAPQPDPRIGMAANNTISRSNLISVGLQAIASKPANAATEAPQKIVKNAAGKWSIQIGAYQSEGQAVSGLAKALKLASAPLSTSYRKVSQVNKNGKKSYRARFTGLPESQARKACQMLQKKRQDCIPIAPSTW